MLNSHGFNIMFIERTGAITYRGGNNLEDKYSVLIQRAQHEIKVKGRSRHRY